MTGLVGLTVFRLSTFSSLNENVLLDMMIARQQQSTHVSPNTTLSDTINHATAAGTKVGKADVSSSSSASNSNGNDPTPVDRLSFYYPTLYNSSHFTIRDASKDLPFLHIVDTPIMTNQLNLTELIEARLRLFESFCLPTLQKQISQDFIWLIRVDTRLSTLRPDWLRRMIDWLKDDPRFFLVERDSNPPWRDGKASQQLAQSKVYTGDRERLEYYMAAYEHKHVLETRIDGDDGLHHAYLQYIQDESVKILSSKPPPSFFYWCVAQELEWHPVTLERRPGPFLQNSTIEPLPPSPYTHGLWMPSPVYKDLCPTPGITRVYPLGTPTERIFRIGHHELWRKFKYQKQTCARPEDEQSPWKELNCTPVVQLSTTFPALRSRSPTSASMVTVGGLNYGHLKSQYQKAAEYWEVASNEFGLNPELIRQTQTYLVDRLLEIAQDGLRGQCSFRHSCMVCFRSVIYPLSINQLLTVTESFALKGKRTKAS
jgi:hypothetical protein